MGSKFRYFDRKSPTIQISGICQNFMRQNEGEFGKCEEICEILGGIAYTPMFLC